MGKKHDVADLAQEPLTMRQAEASPQIIAKVQLRPHQRIEARCAADKGPEELRLQLRDVMSKAMALKDPNTLDLRVPEKWSEALELIEPGTEADIECRFRVGGFDERIPDGMLTPVRVTLART